MGIIYSGKTLEGQVHSLNKDLDIDITNLEEIKQELSNFINNTSEEIKGKGFTAARNYYQTVWYPIINLSKLAVNSFKEANNQLLVTFESHTGESSAIEVNTDVLTEQIQLWQRTCDQADSLALNSRYSTPSSIRESLKPKINKLQTLITNVETYNLQSAQLFVDALTMLNTVENALNGIETSKPWENNYSLDYKQLPWLHNLYLDYNLRLLTSEQIAHFNDLGYTAEEIASWLSLAQNEEDLEFIRNIGSGLYEKAFSYDLSDSPNMVMFASDYIIKVNEYCVKYPDIGIKMLEEIFQGFAVNSISDGYGEDLNIVNIKQGNLALIMAAHEGQLGVCFDAITSGTVDEESMEEFKAYFQRLTDLYSLYNGVYFVTFCQEPKGSRRISNLQFNSQNNGQNIYTFNIEVRGYADEKFFWYKEDDERHTVEKLLSRSGKDTAKYNEAMSILEEKRQLLGEQLKNNVVSKIAMKLVNKIPGVKIVLDTINDTYNWAIKSRSEYEKQIQELDDQVAEEGLLYLLKFFDNFSTVATYDGATMAGTLYTYEVATLINSWQKGGLGSIKKALGNADLDIVKLEEIFNGNNKNAISSSNKYADSYNTACQLVDGTYDFNYLFANSADKGLIKEFQDAISLIESTGNGFLQNNPNVEGD